MFPKSEIKSRSLNRIWSKYFDEQTRHLRDLLIMLFNRRMYLGIPLGLQIFLSGKHTLSCQSL
jgi:hypothetical protein